MIPATSVVVGRERELALLDELVVAIEAPAALVIEGEAGIGKTTLWKHAVELARAHGVRVLTARPAEAETKLSFAALADLVGDALPEALPALPAPQRRALEVALLLREPEGRPDERAVDVAFLAVLQGLTAEGPVLVAIDDAQWLDGPSRAVLEFTVRRLTTEPVALMLARRAGQQEPAPLQLDRALPEERLRQLRLGPLSLGALHRMLRTRIGVSFPRPVLLRLHEVSGGNPFFAIELARALEGRGDSLEPGRTLPVPGTLQELVGQRLAELSAPVREVLAAVAALAEPTVGSVEAICAGNAAVPTPIDAAIDAGVLEPDGDRLRFTHPLLASSVYAALGPQTRNALHRRLANVVDDPEERARHLALAASAPSEKVAAALDEAARRALARGAPIAAAELAEVAARLTPAADTEARRRRTREAAEHYYRAAELPRSGQLLEQLLTELPSGAERADVLLGIAISREDDFEAAVELCERALEEAAGDPTRSSEIEFFLGIAWIVRSNLQCAEEHARKALAFAEQSESDALVAKAIAQLTLIETWRGTRTAGLLERGIRLERKLADPLDFFESPNAVLGRRLMYAGQLDEARALFTHAYANALDQGHEPSHIAVLLNLSELECRAGNWERAAQHAAEGHEIVEQLGLEQSQSGLLHARALVDVHLGHVERARTEAEEGIALAQSVKGEIFRVRNRAVLGFLELSRGDVSAADEALADLPDLLDKAGYGDPGVCAVLPDAVEAALAAGDAERARRLASKLEEQARTVGTPWARSVAARCNGLLAAAEGDHERASEALRAAVAALEGLPLPFERGRTLLALGTTQRRARKKRAARDSLGRAIELFEQLRAPLWAEKARGELARIGGRAPASGDLTVTEERVAALAAEGRTNREVAAALFITPRTVEGHMTQIYAKLGIRSRAELAHRLAGGQPTA